MDINYVYIVIYNKLSTSYNIHNWHDISCTFVFHFLSSLLFLSFFLNISVTIPHVQAVDISLPSLCLLLVFFYTCLFLRGKECRKRHAEPGDENAGEIITGWAAKMILSYYTI